MDDKQKQIEEISRYLSGSIDYSSMIDNVKTVVAQYGVEAEE